MENFGALNFIEKFSTGKCPQFSKILLFFYYLSPLLLFSACIFEISKRLTPDSLPAFVGQWEVVSFWITLAWLLIALARLFKPRGHTPVENFSMEFKAPKFSTGVCPQFSKWAALGLIFLFGFYLRAAVPPKTHRVLFDEDIYLNIAQNIQASDKAFTCTNGFTEFGKFNCPETGLSKEPNGWPFLLSLAAGLFGDFESSGRWTNILFSSFTIVLLFFLASELFTSRVALWAAGIYALFPVPIQWASTVESNPVFTFFASLCVLAALKATKEKGTAFLCFLYPLLILTIQIRPEGGLIIPIVLLILWKGDKPVFSESRWPWLFLVLSLFILIPYATHFNFSRHQDWGSMNQPKLGIQYVHKNLISNLRFFIERRRFPAVDLFLFLIGLVAVRKNPAARWSLFPWLIVSFGLYLFFYAGSYNAGAGTRFSLLLHVPMALLAAAGAEQLIVLFSKKNFHIESILAGLLAFFLFFELPAIRILGEEGWRSRADHDFILSVLPSLPKNAAIFCRTPAEIMVAGQGAVQSWRLNDPNLLKRLSNAGRPMYFYQDYWCSIPVFKDECAKTIQKFTLAPVAGSKTRDQVLGLYRILK